MTPRFFAPFILVALMFGACTDKAADDAPGGSTPRSTATTAETPASPGSTATAGSGQVNGGATPTAPARVEGPAGHEGDRAMAHVQALAGSIGPRVAGTTGEKKAADYIAAQLQGYGYTVEQQEFTFSGDRFRAATLKLGSNEIEAIAMDGSSGGTVAGEAVFVGLADGAGLAGKNLNGKIAVADRGTLTFNEKYEAVAATGAAGLVILNNTEGQLNGRLSTDARFPVLGVAGEDAAGVRAAANSGARLELIADDGGPSKGVNVVAKSAANDTCQVVVGGHYDTVPSAPGANDNASGTANVIELARAMAADGIDKGFCFVAFSAEESGLFGSDAFVRKLEAARQLPKTMVNMDVTGIGTGIELIGDSELVTETLEIAKGLKVDARRSSLPPNTGSDHQSFQKAGVPAVWFFSGDFPTIHSPRDVAGDISAAELDRAGDVAYALLQQLAREVVRG